MIHGSNYQQLLEGASQQSHGTGDCGRMDDLLRNMEPVEGMIAGVEWRWGWLLVHVVAPVEVARSVQFRHVLKDIGDEEVRVSTRQMFRRLHRLLNMEGVGIETRFCWLHLLYTWDVRTLWNYFVFTSHLWLNPRGDGCSCWRPERESDG